MKTRVVLILIIVLISGHASAGVWRVEQDGSGDFMLIQDAVDAAASGDTIMIGPGRYDDLQVRGEMTGASVAYWDDGRDLMFIGTSTGEVIIGPESYEPVGTGPQGFHQHMNTAFVGVEGLTFENLKFCVNTMYGELNVRDSRFQSGYIGIYADSISQGQISNCSFNGYFYSATFYVSGRIDVNNCTLDNAVINFNDTANGIVRNCTVTGGSLVRYYLSKGLVEDCNAQCDGGVSCISVSDCDTVRFYDNRILGGNINLWVDGAGTTVFAERNDFSWPTSSNFYIHSNASFFAHNNHINRSSTLVDYVLFTSTYVDTYSPIIDVSNNYWFNDSSPAQLDSLIHDGNDDPDIHVIVDYEPIRTEPVPVKKSPLGGIKALFR